LTAALLDTDILVDLIRGHQPAVRLIDKLERKPAISVVTLLELVVGAKLRRDEAEIRRIESLLMVLPVDATIAWRAGEHCKHFKAAHGLDDLDAIIAATAEHHELDLATLNVKHFPMFPRLKPAY